MIRSLLSVSYRGVAQFGRALRSGRRGRKFESCRLDDKKCRISFIEILHFFYFLLFFFLFHFSFIRLQCRLKFQKSEKSEKKCKLVIANFLSFCYNSGHGGIAQLGERLNGIQEVMGSNPTISMSHMLEVLIVQGFQHIFCLNAVFIPFCPAFHRYMEVTPMPHHRKKTIDQMLNEYSSEQEYGSCLDCGDDACCEYDQVTNVYVFSCHNEDCPHHWPPCDTPRIEDAPDWFAWPRP